jgi:hypothetical protein
MPHPLCYWFGHHFTPQAPWISWAVCSRCGRRGRNSEWVFTE